MNIGHGQHYGIGADIRTGKGVRTDGNRGNATVIAGAVVNLRRRDTRVSICVQLDRDVVRYHRRRLSIVHYHGKIGCCRVAHAIRRRGIHYGSANAKAGGRSNRCPTYFVAVSHAGLIVGGSDGKTHGSAANAEIIYGDDVRANRDNRLGIKTQHEVFGAVRRQDPEATTAEGITKTGRVENEFGRIKAGDACSCGGDHPVIFGRVIEVVCVVGGIKGGFEREQFHRKLAGSGRRNVEPARDVKGIESRSGGSSRIVYFPLINRPAVPSLGTRTQGSRTCPR